MSAIVPFDGSLPIPAYLAEFRNNPPSALNLDVLTGGPTFPVLSIKGKNFTLVKDSERKMITREIDGEQVPVQSLTLAVVRANTKARAFYIKKFVEGEDQGAPPDCQSDDGIAPNPRAAKPQATKCDICPHAVWGTGDPERNIGHACAKIMRLAVTDPLNPEMKMLLRVPPASRESFQDAVKMGEARKIPYNALVYRVSFEPEVATPKLVFKPVGLVNDELYAQIKVDYESQAVLEIVGLDMAAPAVKPEASELDAAIAAKAVVQKAAAPAITEAELTKALGTAKKTTPKKVEAPVVERVEPVAPAPAPVAAAPAAPAPKAAPQVSEASDLLAGLDALLGNQDD